MISDVLANGPALVAWAASVLVHRTTRGWFENDVRLRAQLAVSGARQALISHWHKEQREELQSLLAEITHDERIMAARACGPDLKSLTQTKDFPLQFDCARIGEYVRGTSDASPADWKTWTAVAALPWPSWRVTKRR